MDWQCNDCGFEDDEDEFAQGMDARGDYHYRCPSCLSENVKPTEDE